MIRQYLYEGDSQRGDTRKTFPQKMSHKEQLIKSGTGRL